ncbi:MAG: UbiA prenyltransferase family protein [Patescibacteria group bacterium]
MANLSTKISKFKKELEGIIPFILVARPVHWIKNLTIFTPLVFTGTLFIKVYFEKSFLAFIAFCFATSATYVFNDILDREKDRLHPIKKNRPVASGKISVSAALLESVVLAGIATVLAESVNHLFFFMVLAYIFMQALYSLFLKKMAIIDILIIAAGFVFRVYAGAFVINAHLSVWFSLCIISVALFLASGKRRSELGIINETDGVTRKSLSKYSKTLLDSYVTMFGNAAWMSWALFTFFESPKASLPLWLFLAEISKTTTINKLLMITIPLTIFGIMRYQSIIFEDRSESPEKVLLTDKPLMASVAAWVLIIIWIYYGGIASFV